MRKAERNMIAWLAVCPNGLDPWQRQFVHGLQGLQGPLSPKQRRKLQQTIKEVQIKAEFRELGYPPDIADMLARDTVELDLMELADDYEDDEDEE